MEGDVSGVRILPPLVEFKDTSPNTLYRVNVTVKNVSKSSKEIRFWGPQQTTNFKLKVKNPEKPVAPGLEVPAIVEYQTSEDAEHQDRLVVTVDGEVLEVQLHGYPCQPSLSVGGPVDFGNMVANSRVITQEIPVYNHGSKEGEFKFKYSGKLPLSIIPSSGKVPPNSAQIVKVEYVTKDVGSFDEVVKVKLEGQDVTTLRVMGSTTEGSLELLSYNTQENLDCISFGNTYYGMDRTETALLCNNSPDPICFVTLLDEEAEGQEIGADLSKSTAAALANSQTGLTTNPSDQTNPLTSLVTAIPSQGVLAPYEKIPIFFRFSPRWNTASRGFTCTEEPAPRQDFALFMHIKVVGANQGPSTADLEAQTKHNIAGSSLEIALTATALPVLISLSPEVAVDFGQCSVGEHVDALCSLTNQSSALPVTFNCKKIAHFSAKPSSGKIKPGQNLDILFSFTPNQVGTFQLTQLIDVLGPVADNRNPFLMHQKVIHSLLVQLLGKADPITTKKKPVFNPGITPKITNEVGLYVDTTTSGAQKNPRAALLNAQGTRLHRVKSSKDRDNEEDKVLVSFPNDRACSVRPSDRRDTYKTIFTRTERHTFVDPDYAYTDEEAEQIQRHKGAYKGFIDDLRLQRQQKQKSIEFKQTNNDMDIAIKPAAGLKPKKLQLKDVETYKRPRTPPNEAFKLMSTKQLEEAEKHTSKKVRDGLNAIPMTAKEKSDCQKKLSPLQLHQINIGPPTVDFGKVCLKSVSQQQLSIVNSLDQHIHVVVHVDCQELRQTSPLSQVLPPASTAVLPLIFESNTKGKFQRSLDYTINGFYKNHLTIFAEVVPVDLQLSTQDLVLEPQIGLPADAGIRGVITLKNSLNHPAEFTWHPILGERGTAFSVRPATGIVEANTDLDCEVVFHPSYMAPEDGEFALEVHGGGTSKLKCQAKLGTTNVTFIDRRIMFGQVPLHLTTTRTAMLKNTSLNHAYFQVLDPNPFPGLSVSPIHGVVPVGGVADLKIHLTPNAVIKFDTRVNISIRGWKTLELRMGGTVEPPVVDIDVSKFNLGGVYCGSSLTTPFKLLNTTHTKARTEFDLSRYGDFTLEFPGHQNAEDVSFQLMNPGLYSVTLDADETVTCQLVFKPTEVACYDFIMPVTINQTGAPTPSPTPLPGSPAPSHQNSLQHIIQPRPVHVHIVTPRRKVVATALRQPLQLSHHVLEFSLSRPAFEMASAMPTGQCKGTLLVNNSDKAMKWTVDLSKGNEILEEGVFRFLDDNDMPFRISGDSGVEGSLDPGQTVSLGVVFCPDKPGHFEVSLPIVINEDFGSPYQYIRLIGELKHPTVWFDPLAIVLTPVPLGMEVTAQFTILAMDYLSKSMLSAHVPEVECADGSKLTPVTVAFPDGAEIPVCFKEEGDSEPASLTCKVTFSSPRPVSFCEPITFKDDLGNSFLLPVTATADNSLLTCYPFLAKHRADHQIVCEKGHTLKGRKTVSMESMNAGEAVLVQCDSPARPSSRPSTTATSSNFEASYSSYEGDSSQSATDSAYGATPREGAMNKFNGDSDQNGTRTGLQSRSLGSALFPEEDTEEGVFHTEVLLSVQRWFASQGWPGGPNPITVPDTLRAGISKKPAEEKVKNSKGASWESNNLKKEFRTVYDMLSHLIGRPVPGIPINNPLPSDPTERAKQVYWQHATLLTFLKTQGACVATIKPEYLMEPVDYKNWIQLQKDLEAIRTSSGRSEIRTKTEEEESLQEQLFEAVSKRAWTDILLQLLKTLILARITPRQFRNIPVPYKNASLPTVDPDPLCSNVYSISERIVLLWLNHHYEQQRQVVWRDCSKGSIPPSRWVVNFDFDLLDGLVLAAALAAHVPFLVESHLGDMYTRPTTAEQCLHNALKVINAMRYIGIEYDIQAIDITDPNPIGLLLFCVHLYHNLPQYIAKTTVEFTGSLHSAVLRQVKLSNPSTKPLVYHAIVAGPDARDFLLPKGDTVIVPPKSTSNVPVEFVSRAIRPAEGVLVLVGRRQGANVGNTLVFNFKSVVDDITPKAIIKCDSPCYELNRIPLEVTNSFSEAGEFRISLIEDASDLLGITATADKQPLLGGASRKKKSKSIRSKIDHGQRKAESPSELASPAQQQQQEQVALLADQKEVAKADEHTLKAFSCPQTTVTLAAGGSSTVHIHFLPFQLGRRQCSVLLSSDRLGELLYSVLAQAVLPLPASLPFRPGVHSVRISSAAAAGTCGRGVDDTVVYWKCESGHSLQEKLVIPLANAAKDRALMVAAQQTMTDVELRRRRVTGTLSSGILTAKAIDMLSTAKSTQPAKSSQEKTLTFTVELDSKHFQAPSTISVPNPNFLRPPGGSASGARPATTTNSSGSSSSASAAMLPTSDGEVELPVAFQAAEPGHYPCTVVLKSLEDVRVYRIECTVTPEGSEAHIEFTSPVHKALTQNIPIMNQTNHDWPMEASIEGRGFSGPSAIIAKAYQTTPYPLVFRPSLEGLDEGSLVLTNTADNVRHKFFLKGLGEKPLPLETITINCVAKQSVRQTLVIPNVTKKKIYYRVETDLPYTSGPKNVAVLPGQREEYELTVMPLRRGQHKGVITFVAGDNPVREVDSDGDDVNEEASDLHGYRVWYSVEINIEAPPPEKTLSIACACQKRAVLEVGVSNPTNGELTLDVAVEGQWLSGPPHITLPRKARGVYELVYSPAVVGTAGGRLVFYHDAVGEFWYNLELEALAPTPTTLPHAECELGRWVRQYLTLYNPTDECLRLIPMVSNSNNFVLERDNEQPLELLPLSTLRLPVTFVPSTLGRGDHEARISFHCQQLGEWVFYMSGTGILPQPQEPVNITAVAGANSTLIIPFRNPLDIPVLVGVSLTDKELQDRKALSEPGSEDHPAPSPFCLLLKQHDDVRLGPKSTLDIPVTFAPQDMKKFEAECNVRVRKEDGSSWLVTPSMELRAPERSMGAWETEEIQWLYPIHGFPELSQPGDSPPALVQCQARERVEERLEVTLSGVAPSAGGPKRGIRTRAVTPATEDSMVPGEIVVGETLALAEEFTYEIVYNNSDVINDLDPTVALKLVRQQRDKSSGLVVLVFNVVYAPYKPMNYEVQLLVTGATGGVWRFPLRFLATEPDPDDLIVIEAVGLHQESSVGFRLNSQTRHPIPYNAYFVAGSDPEFAVTPQSGELLPSGTNGTLIKIIFKPTKYGKNYQAKLVVQGPDIQWTYSVRGVLPDYMPPRGCSSRPMAGPHPDPRRRGGRTNYLQENLRLTTTAVSSPIKGAPLLTKNKPTAMMV